MKPLRTYHQFLEFFFRKVRCCFRFIEVSKKFSGSCLSLRYQTCVILSVVVKKIYSRKELHMHFPQFVWPLTQHSKVEFFPQTDPGSRMPIRALVTQQLNINSQFWTWNFSWSVPLQTRTIRSSVERSSTLFVWRTVHVKNSLSKFKASNFIRFLLLSLLGWCLDWM